MANNPQTNNPPSPIIIFPETLEPLSIFFAAAITWFAKDFIGDEELQGFRMQVYCAKDIETAKQIVIESILHAYTKDTDNLDLPDLARFIIIPLHTYISTIAKGENFYEDQPVTEINFDEFLHSSGQ